MKKRSFEVLFFDRGSDIAIKNRAVLILSPSFYWFHKEKLDISPSQAKKIAPSIFEGMIPDGEYSYFVQKVADEYHFYAYEDQKILQALQERGIKPSQIVKVYPAQEVFADLDAPVLVGEKVIVSENGVVMALPKDLAGSEVKKIDLNSLKLPKKSLPLKTYTSGAIPEEQIYTLAVLLFVAIVLYAIQAFVHKKSLAALMAQESVIKERYHLPPTTIQLKSILSSLEKVQKEQLALREQIEYILRLPLLPTEYIKKLDLSKRIRFEVVLSSPKRAEAIKEYLIKRLSVKDLTLSDKTLFVECTR